MRHFLKEVTFSVLLAFAAGDSILAQERSVQLFDLWTGDTMPSTEDLSQLNDVYFQTIKTFEPDKDGYRWLHGLAISRFEDQWVVTFGHNKGAENSGSELAQSMFSRDGKSWSPLIPIDNPAGDWAVSHGVLVNHRDTLWSFNGSFYGALTADLRTKGYIWDPGRKEWQPQGVVAVGSFSPTQQPVRMQNGEWIMAGRAVVSKDRAIPAVAISKRGDFTKWRVTHLPIPQEMSIWGESAIIVEGSDVLLISRSHRESPKFDGHGHPLAWVSTSNDYGYTWTELQPSNLPMAASKPYTGILSTGQRYLIGTTTANARNTRNPLTIAVSKPGENSFSKIYCIRQSIHEGGEVESNPKAALAYPYAVEYEDHLYVVYSNTGGRVAKDHSTANQNSAELAIIPISELKSD